MSIASKYYTDTATVRICTGTNDRGDTVYEPAVSVPCRLDYTPKETLDAQGNHSLSTATMLCGMYIPPLSIVKTAFNECFVVKSCEPVRRISGEIDHYEVII